MPLVEQLYCTQQINVPPNLPTILKQFCKAAIRTQPYDLLKWSSTYFRALANGEELPIKLRLEYPPPSTESGLTLGFLKVLLRQFGDYNKNLSIDTVSRRWDGLCLENSDFKLIVSIGGFRDTCMVKKFLSIGVALLSNTLHETMIMICELFTHEPEGGSGMIPFKLFMELYGYLAGLEFDGTSVKGEYENENSSDVKKNELDSKSSILVNQKEDYRGSNSGEKSGSVVSEKFQNTESTLVGKNFKGESSMLEKNRRVPGIGARISPEHISTVELWMSECARLQEGMVGPRNLRHFECPSLDETEIQQRE